MSNIIPIAGTEAIGARCRRLLKEWEAASDRWIEKTMELAAALLTARNEHADDVSFGVWLVREGMDALEKNDRAALLKMANYPELSRRALSKTRRQSISLIWEQEIKPQITTPTITILLPAQRASATAKLLRSHEVSERSETDPTRNDMNRAEEYQENQQPTPEQPVQETGTLVAPEADIAPPAPVVAEYLAPSNAPPGKAPFLAPAATPVVEAARISPQAGYFGMPRVEEMIALFPNQNARSALSMAIRESAAAKKEIWNLILTCADAGLLRRSDYAPRLTGRKLLLRILLTDIPETLSREYDLTVPAIRREVRNVVLPAILDQKDAFLKEPATLKRLINNWKIKRAAAQTAERQANPPVHAPAVINPPDNHPVVVMFGVQLWPIQEMRYGSYDYDQLRTAIWVFQEVDRLLRCGSMGTTPKARAIMARFSTRYYGRYVERALDKENGGRMQIVFQLVHTLATLLETHPDAACNPPMAPHGDLGWD